MGGLIAQATSAVGVLGAVVAPRAARLGTARAVLVGKLGVAPFGLLIPLADRGPRLALFLFGGMTIFAGIVAGNIIWSGFVQSYYRHELLGRVPASIQFVNYGGIPAGAITAAMLGGHLGVRPTLWIM